LVRGVLFSHLDEVAYPELVAQFAALEAEIPRRFLRGLDASSLQ
jgi:hypothetical protein